MSLPVKNTRLTATSVSPGSMNNSQSDTQSGKEDEQYLTFKLANEMFAIGILSVKEILEYGMVTPVPMVPDFIRGVINLRGAVVPVIDLARRFGQPSNPVTKRTCVVIIEVAAEGQEGKQQDIGIMVDSVSEVLEISSSEIEPAPTFGARIRTDFIQGMGKVKGVFVVILEVNKVLSVDELAQIGQVAGQGQADSELPSTKS